MSKKARFKNWVYPLIEEGKPTKYGWRVDHVDKVKLGFKTDIGVWTYINAKFGVTIEDFVQIGSHCSIYSVSTIDDKKGPVVLKRNCRIGSHCVVMPGVTVGENAVVGACSFVNEDVPENVVAYGTPVEVHGLCKEAVKAVAFTQDPFTEGVVTADLMGTKRPSKHCKGKVEVVVAFDHLNPRHLMWKCDCGHRTKWEEEGTKEDYRLYYPFTEGKV
jgi:acetyltransferase-like isoleucine patch superfamily enzyme